MSSACPVSGCSARLIDHASLRSHLVSRHDWTVAEAWQHQQREHRQRQLQKLLAYSDRMRGWTLDTFPADDLAGRRALLAARAWPHSGKPRVVIDGPPGTGKTGLAYGMARAWLATGGSPEVEFVNVRALLAEQRARFSRGEPEELESLVDHYGGDESLVVLDDLGAERPTEYALEVVALIVEHLHLHDAALIATTNYSPASLAARLGRADAVVGQRIVSRLIEDCQRIRLDRADQRTRSHDHQTEEEGSPSTPMPRRPAGRTASPSSAPDATATPGASPSAARTGNWPR